MINFANAMKQWAGFILTLLTVLPAYADERRPAQEEYIRKYADVAVQEMYRSGVPASITLAQGLLESGAGRSSLAAKGNNHFGIKCHNNWTGKTMRVDDDRRKECFRVYASAEESFRDHSDFLRYRDRYKFLFDLETSDYKGWAHGLKKAGYATDPAYAAKLIKYIEDYELYRYDSGQPQKSKAQKMTRKEKRAARKAARQAKRTRAPAPIPESPLMLEAPQPLSEIQKEVIRFSMTRPVYTRNGVPFVYAVKGDTYGRIASENKLFLKEILRFNEVRGDGPLQPGSIVYLRAKKRGAVKGLDKYVADADGESLWAVSQRFGVRLSSILKLNGLTEGDSLREGDEIILR